MVYRFARHARVVLACLAASTLIATMSPTAAEAANQEEANRAIIARSFEAWAAGTGGPYDLLAEDAVWTITGNSAAGRTYGSREDFMSAVIRPFNARMLTPLVPKVRRLYAEGDTIIVFFDASGTARDGRPYANTYVWLLQMSAGRIARAHAFFDSIAFDDLWRRVEPTAAGGSATER